MKNLNKGIQVTISVLFIVLAAIFTVKGIENTNKEDLYIQQIFDKNYTGNIHYETKIYFKEKENDEVFNTLAKEKFQILMVDCKNVIGKDQIETCFNKVNQHNFKVTEYIKQ